MIHVLIADARTLRMLEGSASNALVEVVTWLEAPQAEPVYRGSRQPQR